MRSPVIIIMVPILKYFDTVTILNTIFGIEYVYVVIFNHLAEISNVALFVVPIVHCCTACTLVSTGLAEIIWSSGTVGTHPHRNMNTSAQEQEHIRTGTGTHPHRNMNTSEQEQERIRTGAGTHPYKNRNM